MLINRKIHPLIMMVPLMLVVTIATTSFVYTEGDDASIIAYHSQGRNYELQQPYSLYSFGYDAVLSVFPSDETVLRLAAYAINWLSIALLLFMATRIVTYEYGREVELGFQLIILAIWPFLFLHGCTVLPNTTAMALMLCAHYLVIRWRGWVALLAAGALVGFAVAVRWDVAPYLLAIALYPKHRLSAYNLATLGVLSLGMFILLLYAQGYTAYAAYETVVQMRQYFVDVKESVYGQVADFMTMATPGFMLLLVLGAVRLLRDGEYRLVIIGSMMMFFSLYMNSGLLYVKYSLLALPFLMMVVYRGYMVLSSVKKPLFMSIFVLLLVVPWIVGLRVDAAGTSWGPGFEVNQCQNADTSDGLLPDDRMKINTFHPVFNAGFAVPTKDGVRPLYGYLHLVLGRWKSFCSARERERESMVDAAINSTSNVLVAENKTAYLVVVLNRRKYYMRDADRDIAKHRDYTEYHYRDNNGKSVYMIVPASSSAFGSDEFLARLGGRSTPFYSRYTERYRSIKKVLGERLTPVTAFTGYIVADASKGP